MSNNITLKKIAAELGVSAMTVSRALNNHDNVDENTKKTIVETAKKMGYTPNRVAKSLVSSRTYTIGVVIPEISHAFFAQVVSGIENVTYEKDYQLLLTNSAEKFERENKALETLLAQQVDGILVSCSEETTDFSLLKRIIDTGKPLVFFDRCVEGIGASTVSVDDRNGSYNMTQHMIDHGYKTFAYLSGPQISTGKERLEGFRNALKDNKLDIKEEWIVESGFQEKGGYEAMKKILELPGDKMPRAVLAVNDPAAIGAIEAIEEFGYSIPDDIAITGFSDDIRARLLKCPLTTVYQPSVSIGRKAAEKLIKVIENKDEPAENIDLLTDLVIRQSCGCNK
ncbi:MAG: LacI family DNA-binding transcriptional regulator [Balneolaceae bacterium]|nr:LacI family DNA-binding transcriptional regulator [Balneolaceae bacterium]